MAGADIPCAHCHRTCESDQYRCSECGGLCLCARCAGEVGLQGARVMLQIARDKEARERHAERRARQKAYDRAHPRPPR